MVKLVVHIGHGKTGSSSIQRSLLEAKTRLSSQGVKYLGLMLEHAGNSDRPAWQVRSGSDRFFYNTPAAQANLELAPILAQELAALEKQNIAVAVWSNEWLLSRPGHTIDALKSVQAAGYDIEVQCYVRRHDKWALSAYAQWGLKHKSYVGPIRNFSNWLSVFGERDFRFSPSLALWEAAFGNRLSLFNFDAAGDVVQHFMQVNGLKDITSINENVSSDPVLAVAQSVFNARKAGQVLPGAFDAIVSMAERGDENRMTLPMLDELMPSAEMLNQMVNDRADDIAKVNALLIRSGEPPLSFDTPPKLVRHPSPWETDQFILKLLYSIAEEAGQMRNHIAVLQQQVVALKNDGKR